MAGVVLAGVSRVYPGVVAVGDLDLEVRDRELLALVGPSGCGKTTTLRLIAGLERASSGTIRIGERIVNDEPPRRRNVAMVFQGSALYPHLTVRQNLAFGLELRHGRRLRRHMAARVEAAAEGLGIADLLDRRPEQLSGGERQRVALGRAIVHEPEVFLFDEPLSNLDAQLRVQMRYELKQLHKRLATTMVYVTHDQTEALALADRVAVMERGRLRQVGRPQEVYDRPADSMVARFFGSPPMNLIEGELISQVVPNGQVGPGGSGPVQHGPGARVLRFEGQGWSAAIDERWLGAPCGRVTMGIRPEDVYVEPSDGLGRTGADEERASGERTESPGERTESPGEWARASRGEVAAIEPLGYCTIVHVMPADRGTAGLERHVVKARTAARTALRPGQRVGVWFAASRLHWFDARTRVNLGPPAP